jgi:hypothetical protein
MLSRTLRLLTFSALIGCPGATALGEHCPPRGSCCPPVVHPLARAGHPETISPLAVFSNNCNYGGYYVGGGLPFGGESRCVFHEGTWGWDYFGILFPKKIVLRWGHGSHEQGGTGAYQTDGPKLRHE